MAAQIVIVEQGRVLQPETVERLWFFSEGSEHLRYSPHFHMIRNTGFRSNFPLVYGFVVVMDGKLSVKDYFGKTIQKINVRDQVWYSRDRGCPLPGVYASLLRVETFYERNAKPVYG